MPPFTIHVCSDIRREKVNVTIALPAAPRSLAQLAAAVEEVFRHEERLLKEARGLRDRRRCEPFTVSRLSRFVDDAGAAASHSSHSKGRKPNGGARHPSTRRGDNDNDENIDNIDDGGGGAAAAVWVEVRRAATVRSGDQLYAFRSHATADDISPERELPEPRPTSFRFPSEGAASASEGNGNLHYNGRNSSNDGRGSDGSRSRGSGDSIHEVRTPPPPRMLQSQRRRSAGRSADPHHDPYRRQGHNPYDQEEAEGERRRRSSPSRNPNHSMDDSRGAADRANALTTRSYDRDHRDNMEESAMGPAAGAAVAVAVPGPSRTLEETAEFLFECCAGDASDTSNGIVGVSAAGLERLLRRRAGLEDLPPALPRQLHARFASGHSHSHQRRHSSSSHHHHHQHHYSQQQQQQRLGLRSHASDREDTNSSGDDAHASLMSLTDFTRLAAALPALCRAAEARLREAQRLGELRRAADARGRAAAELAAQVEELRRRLAAAEAELRSAETRRAAAEEEMAAIDAAARGRRGRRQEAQLIAQEVSVFEAREALRRESEQYERLRRGLGGGGERARGREDERGEERPPKRRGG